MIVSLRTEREQERQSHKRTFRDAECRIAELEAKVARRDAELEACIAHVHHTSGSTPEIEPKDQINRERMTKEDALALMETTTVKNKVLELEVQGLFRKVCASVPPFPRYICIYIYQLHDARKRVVSQEKPSPSLNSPASYIPISENMVKSRKGPTSTSHEPESCATPSHLRDTQDDPTIQPPSQHSPSTLQQSQPIRDLDRQIEALAFEVDAFQSERNRLVQFVSKEKQVCGPTNI